MPKKLTKKKTPEAEPVAAPEPGPGEVPESTGGEVTKVQVKTILDVVGFTRGREAGRKEGFAEGIRYIVTLAEENLAKSLKLTGRRALGESGRLPAWWIATLVKALGVDDLPDDIALKDQREVEPAPEGEEM